MVVSRTMKILGIETTCDETGVGIVRDGVEILANVVASSASMHEKYGGIVPEVAAREQVKVIVPTLEETLRSAQCLISDIDAIAVANGPGLVGSLLIGVETAKTLALVLDKPLIPVNHLIAHIYANWICEKVREVREVRDIRKVKTKTPEFPLIALIVTGGHTDLTLMAGHNKFKWLGGTLDDAAGEAFDKVARVLGLPYPGGPEVERIAQKFKVQSSHLRNSFGGQAKFKVKLPRPMINEENFDFSFSGLKTAVVNLVNRQSSIVNRNEIAYEFQQSVIDVLVTKTLRAAKKFNVRSIVVGGGVAANSFLQNSMDAAGKDLGIRVYSPTKKLSVDNGVMIATAAFFQKKFIDPLKISANPGLYFKKLLRTFSSR